METNGRTLTLTQERVLKNELPDIQAWVDELFVGKVNKCKKRMLRKWTAILTADPDVETIPADDDKLIELIVARDDYETAAEREGG